MPNDERLSSGGPGRNVRARLWTFRLLSALVLPVVALGVTELGLRATGIGYPATFTLPCRAAAGDAVCENPKFTWRFFPPRIARSPISFAFPAEKSQGTYRIFVLGGSAAQGDPGPSYGFARLLQVMLRERYPGERFEVVNSAVTAINSHVVLPIARDLARHEGDLFILYLGNNEVVGPFGAGTVFSPLTSSLRLIRANVYLGSTRIGQIVARGLGGLETADRRAEWGGMEMFLKHRVRAGSPRMESVYSHFRENMVDMIDEIRVSGADVIVSTVGTNLRDCAPFASLHREDLAAGESVAWEAVYREGIESETAGRLDDALRAYREAERIDGNFADLHYRMGRTHWALGEFQEARVRWVQALNLDALRFRADTRINDIIRSVVSGVNDERVHLFDADRTLKNHSSQGAPGSELFHEHVHMNLSGNYLLAREMLETIESVLPDRLRRSKADRPDLTEEQCARRLAYTGFDRHRVATDIAGRLQRPPFTGQSNHAEQLSRAEERVRRLAAFTTPAGLASTALEYSEAIAREPDDPWLRFNHGVLLDAVGDPVGAEREFRAFLDDLPQDLQGREKLCSALAAQRRFDTALAECQKLIDGTPHFPTPYYTKAYVLAQLGRLDESIAVYRELLELDPSSWPEIYNQIGRIQIRRERFAAAIATYEEALGRGDYEGGTQLPDLYYNYGFALRRVGNTDKARIALEQATQLYREELARIPGDPGLRLALGSALVEGGHLEEAAQQFGELVRLDPADYSGHYHLTRTLETLGRIGEAASVCRQGIVTLRAHGRNEEALRLQPHLERLLARRPG